MSNRLLLSVVIAGAAIGLSACAPKTDEAQSDPITRGSYLALIGGCGDCHTPLKNTPAGPAPDESMLLAGHPATLAMPVPTPTGNSPWAWYGAITSTAFAGPWGISYSVNLTPDPETGLGDWTEAQFMTAMRTGMHRGNGRRILPPMPWPNLARMKDEDLAALFAYLRSIPPIANRVPEAVIAAPPAPPG